MIKKILFYHNFPISGKISIENSKLLSTKAHLSLSYTPGVALISKIIYKDFFNVYKYTIKSNLVAIITNGTAVLGLGNIGCLPSKPVMEGKSSLFKKFADIIAFDIEINEINPDKLLKIILSLKYSINGINLEDIKAPECFYIEQNLKKHLNIPVFHDDQHGTAIVVCSSILNYIKFLNKDISKIRILSLGAGSASIACLNLLLKLGILKKNIYVFDSKGLISFDRIDLDCYKQQFIVFKKFINLNSLNFKFDIFLGCSKGNLLYLNILKFIKKNGFVMSLANPNPEILPEIVKFIVGENVIVSTGRSDYDNQVNNLLCYPFIFRGSLDILLKNIINIIKIKCVEIISNLVKNNFLEKIYFIKNFLLISFNKNFIIPSPFDFRLIIRIPFIVIKYSIILGINNFYIKNLNFYIKKLSLVNLR